jgi:nitrate reductase alpha subunit
MLSLSRGGPTIWMSPADAGKVGVLDNDWIEAVNRNGVVVARAIVSSRMPEGTVYMYHAQERTDRRPDRGDLRQARRHPQLADAAADEAHSPGRRLRADQLRLQLHRPHGQPAR